MLQFKLPRYVVYSVRFSPDGRNLLVTTGEPALRVLDALTGETVWADRDRRQLHHAAFSPDGRTVYEMAGQYPEPPFLHTRDADTGRHCGAIPTYGQAFAVTPDGKHLLHPSGWRSVATASGTVTDLVRADLATGGRLDVLPLETVVQTIAVSPDGRRAAARGTYQFALVDLEAWSMLASLALAQPNAVSHGTRFAPDGRTVVSSVGPHLHVWDAESGGHRREVRDRGTHVQDLAFTPDGRHVFTASNDATVKVRDTTTWEVVRQYTWNAGKLRCVDVSPDGTLAAVGSATGKIVVWDVDV